MCPSMDPLEPLGVFRTRSAAERARRWLDDEGISAQLTDVGPRSEGIAASLHDAAANQELGEVRLDVAREDLDLARTILAREADEDADLPATGITSFPERVRKKTADEDQPDSERDVIVRRAWLAAAFGLVTLPLLLHLYSLIVLLDFSQAHGPLSQRGKRQLLGAIVIDAFVVGAFLLVGLLFCGGLFVPVD
jgi:hypothetical protein